MIGDIIFIGGIHGVGKGTMCKEISQKYSLEHLSASEVLKWEEISDKKNKKVENFVSTKSRLINGLKNIIKPNIKYLLDGHFCLLNKNEKPEKIQEDIFYSINPKAIVVMTCEIDTIISRLSSRDKSNYNYEILSEMQNLETQYAKEIARNLKIPFMNIKDGNYIPFSEYLEKL